MMENKDASEQIGGSSERAMSVMASEAPARRGRVRGWPYWTPYAALAWSMVYAVLGLFWALSGRGFPYSPGLMDSMAGPVAGRFGPNVAWVIVVVLGIPAAALGLLMLRGVRKPRLLIITAGALIAGILLLLMTDLTLLVTLGYVPYTVVALIRGSQFGSLFLQSLAQSLWIITHQLLCLVGGFIWLAATVSYARRSTDACPYCGRRDGPEGWNSPPRAARWGRIAVYVSMVAPIIYAVTRYAWALGIPLGMTEAYLHQGQEKGLWVSGLFLATFGLVGALLSLGLVQRWGEVFPRWMPGLGGRQVPIALAVVPASIVSVLLIVGGIAIAGGYAALAAGATATEQSILIVVGPTLLFPVWGAALAVGTLGYYYRRRGPCGKCGRGTTYEANAPRPAIA